MEYSFTVDPKQGYLHAKVSGVNSPDTVRRYMVEIHDACARHGLPQVLIEESLQGPSLSTAVVYGLIRDGTTNAWPVVTKIAFVDVNPQHDPSLMKFAETVAVNRGIEVAVFKDIAAAARWLTAGGS